MNAKKSKALRRAVRTSGADPREVDLVLSKPIFIAGVPPQPGATFLGQRELTKAVGRGAYQALKRAVIRCEVAY